MLPFCIHVTSALPFALIDRCGWPGLPVRVPSRDAAAVQVSLLLVYLLQKRSVPCAHAAIPLPFWSYLICGAVALVALELTAVALALHPLVVGVVSALEFRLKVPVTVVESVAGLALAVTLPGV